MGLPLPESHSGNTRVHLSTNANAIGAQRSRDQRPTPLRSDCGSLDRSLRATNAQASSDSSSSLHRRARKAQRAQRGARALGGMVRSALARTAHRLKRRALQVVRQLAAIEVRAHTPLLTIRPLSLRTSAHTDTHMARLFGRVCVRSKSFLEFRVIKESEMILRV